MTDEKEEVYTPLNSGPSSDDIVWDNWADSVELRLSNQGKIIAGVIVGVGTSLLLTALQGSIVIRLVKGQKLVIEAINTISGVLNPTDNADHYSPSYSEPQGRVDESKITPVDEQEFEELQKRLDNTPPEPPVD